MATRDVIKALYKKIGTSRQIIRDLKSPVNSDNLTEVGLATLDGLDDNLSDAEAVCRSLFKAEGIKVPTVN